MAERTVPRFHNEPGVRVVAVGAREFECIGAKPPFDHPHVYLDMGEENELVCPYCSTLFRFRADLGPGRSDPEECLYRDPEPPPKRS